MLPLAHLSRRPLLRLIAVIVALLHVWTAQAGVLSESHLPAPTACMVEAAELSGLHVEHAHTHEACDSAESGAAHGHHLADHSHDPGSLPPARGASSLRSPAAWRAALPWALCHGPSFPFDRPPKA